MDPDLQHIVEDALRTCFQQIADASKGKLSPEDAARMFRDKANELVAELGRGPVAWDTAPYRNVRELYRPAMINSVVRIQVTVERYAEPLVIAVVVGDRREERVLTQVTLVDRHRSAIKSLPVTAADLVARLDELRVVGRTFEALGVVVDVPMDPLGQVRAFRLLLLGVRPITTCLQALQASKREVEEVEQLLASVLAARRTPFDYVREDVCRHLGIIEVANDDAFSRAIDTAVVTAFSSGKVRGTPGTVHHLVIGPSGVGKKLLAQIARTLQPVHSEIGVTKVTEAGLCGAAMRKNGIWTHTPGLLPRAHGGAFVAEDVHELAPSVRRSLVGMLLKLMEDGRLLDSTAAAAEYEVHASVHFDQNVKGDVWDGDAEPRYTFQALLLPKHFVGRADIITALPRDDQRQQDLACEIAGAPDGQAEDRSWVRSLQLLVALSRDRFAEPRVGGVARQMRAAVEELCRANSVEVTTRIRHFHDFMTRLAISLRKIARAVCRSRALDIATVAEVDEAKRLLRAKVEFLARLEPDVVAPSSWATKAARQRGIRQEFGGQEVTVNEVVVRCGEQGAAVDARTVRRDLQGLGGKVVTKGRWTLPP